MGGEGHQCQRDRAGLYRDQQHRGPRNDPERNKAILERIPAGRWGEPDDIGESGGVLGVAGREIHPWRGAQRRRRLACPLTSKDCAARRPNPGPGIVHLGLGAFFRGFRRDLCRGCGRAVGRRLGHHRCQPAEPGVRDRLAPSRILSTGGDAGCGRRNLPPGRDRAGCAGCAGGSRGGSGPLMADPAIRIVTLTVTEKGYCHDPATGRLNLDHPDIIHDLSKNPLPQSRRPAFWSGRCSGGTPRAAAVHRADLRQPSFERQAGSPCGSRSCRPRSIRACRLDSSEGRFPSTMVDRITPATKPEDIERWRTGLSGRGAGDVRTVPAMGDRGRLRAGLWDRPARTWPPPGSRWSTMSRPMST
jgi:hypothetical protein